MDGLKPVFSERGKQILDEVTKCFPHPVLLIGETGWGKSVLSREAAKRKGLKYVNINAHPGMDMGLLVGMWRPKSTQKGNIEVVWEDGLLTRAIRQGSAFLFEELTRAPQEAVSRLHGVLDTSFRYWSLPEAGEENVPVSENFWFIGTANPAGQGYSAQRLEKALAARFIARFDIDEPLADEEAVLSSMVPDNKVAGQMLKLAEDARRNKKSRITTRDLVQWASMISQGFTAKRAFEISVAPKFPLRDGLMALAEAHF